MLLFGIVLFLEMLLLLSFSLMLVCLSWVCICLAATVMSSPSLFKILVLCKLLCNTSKSVCCFPGGPFVLGGKWYTCFQSGTLCMVRVDRLWCVVFGEMKKEAIQVLFGCCVASRQPQVCSLSSGLPRLLMGPQWGLHGPLCRKHDQHSSHSYRITKRATFAGYFVLLGIVCWVIYNPSLQTGDLRGTF